MSEPNLEHPAWYHDELSLNELGASMGVQRKCQLRIDEPSKLAGQVTATVISVETDADYWDRIRARMS